jgi:hypothetical protein
MPKRKAGRSVDGFNPISEWEEHLEVEGLTLWDLNRPVWTIKEDTAAAGKDGEETSKKTSKDSNDTVDAAILHSDIKVRESLF